MNSPEQKTLKISELAINAPTAELTAAGGLTCHQALNTLDLWGLTTRIDTKAGQLQ